MDHLRRPAGGPDISVPTGEPPGRIRIDTARQTGSSLEEDLFSRSRWPSLEVSFPLLHLIGKLVERIHRAVQTQTNFEYARQQENSAPDELVFIKLDSRLDASHKTRPDPLADLPDNRAALHAAYSRDLFASSRRINEIIQQQNFAERLGTGGPQAVHNRQVIQEQVRDQTPLGAAPHRRSQRVGRFFQTSDAGYRTCRLRLEVGLYSPKRQPTRKIAISACRSYDQSIDRRYVRAEV